jgi:hypothetical protein
MKMNAEFLYRIIFESLKKEDLELSNLTTQGIFYAPELYIAFVLGKKIKENEEDIFGEKIEWLRETDFKNGGISDFAFKTSDKSIVFELKLRDTKHAYRRDIEKLKKLDKTKFTGCFIAIVDSFETQKENDARIAALELQFPELKRASKIESFKTCQGRYKSQIYCTVAIWILKNE